MTKKGYSQKGQHVLAIEVRAVACYVARRLVRAPAPDAGRVEERNEPGFHPVQPELLIRGES